MRLRPTAHTVTAWFPSVPATRFLLGLALLALVLCGGAFAQQVQSAGKLPDTPSASKGQQPAAKPAQKPGNVVDLLAGRSRVFPNLAVNTKPLTTEEKFVLFARNSVSGLTIVGSAMGAGISQARDTYSGYGEGAEGYFKRFGTEMGFAASSNFFGTFMIASALHADPRYFVQNSGKFGESVKYATSRVFVCRMDDGSRGVNWAGLLGPLGASALSNAYVPPDSQGVGPTFSRWGTALAITAGTNLLREYWPHINKKLRLPDMGLNAPGAVGPPPVPPAQAPSPK